MAASSGASGVASTRPAAASGRQGDDERRAASLPPTRRAVATTASVARAPASTGPSRTASALRSRPSADQSDVPARISSAMPRMIGVAGREPPRPLPVVGLVREEREQRGEEQADEGSSEEVSSAARQDRSTLDVGRWTNASPASGVQRQPRTCRAARSPRPRRAPRSPDAPGDRHERERPRPDHPHQALLERERREHAPEGDRCGEDELQHAVAGSATRRSATRVAARPPSRICRSSSSASCTGAALRQPGTRKSVHRARCVRSRGCPSPRRGRVRGCPRCARCARCRRV